MPTDTSAWVVVLTPSAVTALAATGKTPERGNLRVKVFAAVRSLVLLTSTAVPSCGGPAEDVARRPRRFGTPCNGSRTRGCTGLRRPKSQAKCETAEWRSCRFASLKVTFWPGFGLTGDQTSCDISGRSTSTSCA